MLQITVPASEWFNEATNEFINYKEQTLQLEHSLVSLSKWESKWCKPFFSKKEKSLEETLDYIRCMTLTKNVDESVYSRLTRDNIEAINKYIEAPMTATYISQSRNGGVNNETVTSELIYYWMISLQIPFECQKWHLNRLLKLVQVCNVKNSPPKKMSKRERASSYASLNAARRQRMNTRG